MTFEQRQLALAIMDASVRCELHQRGTSGQLISKLGQRGGTEICTDCVKRLQLVLK